MIARFFLIALIVVVQACSSSSELRDGEMPSAGVPSWVLSPSDECSVSSELCASGEGNNFKQSDLAARKSLASVFSTKIRYKFEINKLTASASDKTEITEKVSSNLNQQVDQVLRSSSIKKRFDKDGSFYSLAIIDKRKTQKILTNEIKVLDDQLLHQYRLKNRLYLKKMLIAFHTRSELNEKLIILTNKSIEPPLTISQIELIKYMSSNNEKVFVNGHSKLPKPALDKFKSMLTDLNFKLVSKNAADFGINFDYSSTEAHLNVEGFKKVIFHITVEVTSGEKGRIGGYSLDITTQGRTIADCENKMLKQAESQFEQNIEKLNLK